MDGCEASDGSFHPNYQLLATKHKRKTKVTRILYEQPKYRVRQTGTIKEPAIRLYRRAWLVSLPLTRKPSEPSEHPL